MSIFIYLFGCGWFYLQHVGSSSLTRDQTRVPCIGSLESYSLDHRFIMKMLGSLGCTYWTWAKAVTGKDQ